MHFQLTFEDALDDDLVAELEKSASYASHKLDGLRVSADRRSAEFACSEGDEAEVRAKLAALVASLNARFRDLEPAEELARGHRRDDGPIADAFAELARRGWARRTGRGQVALSGGALELARALDDAVSALARERFGAVEEDHPTLLDADVLSRCRYFGSFPHSVSFVSHLREDFDAIESFRRANAKADTLRVPDAGAFATDAVLRPTICIPMYHAREGERLPRGGRVLTSAGRCYRYESKNMVGMRRLWDFSMREIVFLGDADSRRETIVACVTSLAEKWDLSFRLVSASDPFFPTVRAAKALWQRTRAAKYELVVDIADGTIAAGSINFPDETFAAAFGITTDDGTTATTACIGFGLERLVLALFAQHGFDRKRWPGALGERALG